MPYKNPEDQRRCARKHYLANVDVYKARADASRRSIRDQAKTLILEAKNQPCADCSIRYPYYVMQFDHRPNETKLFTIGNMAGRRLSLIKIKTEIAKCDVVCANCHAERTHQRRVAAGEDDV